MIDPAVFFFIVGVLVSLAKVDIKLPRSIYEVVSIFLLLTIGIKGGIELSQHSFTVLAPKIAAVFALGVTLPLLAYPILKRIGKFNKQDAASIAAHYGSVSVGTYAVSISFLQQMGVEFESFMTLFLVILEFPAILVGIILAKGLKIESLKQRDFLHEIFLGKSPFLLGVGLLFGYAYAASHAEYINKFFISNFKAALAIFLFEMGIVAAKELKKFMAKSRFLLMFGIGMPLFSGVVGVLLGVLLGLSIGGTTLLATLAASASYIAVPAAMRTSVPEANPSLSLGSSLGITFPFNIIFGIPLYFKLTQMMIR